jgi:thiol-disulfide isomerase/thioredoxin
MKDTNERQGVSRRLVQALSLAGHGVVLVVCLGILGDWLVRVTPVVRRWVHPPAVPAFGAAEVVYFFEPGCPACKRTGPILDRLERRYSQYRWARVDISYPRGFELAEQYYQQYRLPVRQRGTIPMVFAGGRRFTGLHEIRDKLPAYLGRATLARPQPRKQPAADAGTAAAASIQERFASFGVAPVLAAGLMYMTQVEGHRLRATGLLLLYDLMFVAPLIVLFFLSSLGVSSRALAAFFTRRTALSKLAMSVLFAGFSIYMFMVSVRMLSPL